MRLPNCTCRRREPTCYPQIPYFNAPIYLENKTQIGKVEEILGPINKVVSRPVLPRNAPGRGCWAARSGRLRGVGALYVGIMTPFRD